MSDFAQSTPTRWIPLVAGGMLSLAATALPACGEDPDIDNVTLDNPTLAQQTIKPGAPLTLVYRPPPLSALVQGEPGAGDARGKALDLSVDGQGKLRYLIGMSAPVVNGPGLRDYLFRGSVDLQSRAGGTLVPFELRGNGGAGGDGAPIVFVPGRGELYTIGSHQSGEKVVFDVEGDVSGSFPCDPFSIQLVAPSRWSDGSFSVITANQWTARGNGENEHTMQARAWRSDGALTASIERRFSVRETIDTPSPERLLAVATLPLGGGAGALFYADKVHATVDAMDESFKASADYSSLITPFSVYEVRVRESRDGLRVVVSMLGSTSDHATSFETFVFDKQARTLTPRVKNGRVPGYGGRPYFVDDDGAVTYMTAKDANLEGTSLHKVGAAGDTVLAGDIVVKSSAVDLIHVESGRVLLGIGGEIYELK